MDSDKIIAIVLGLYILSALIPGAFSNFFGANTTGWDTGTIALWGLIPLFVIIGLIRFYGRKDGGAA